MANNLAVLALLLILAIETTTMPATRATGAFRPAFDPINSFQDVLTAGTSMNYTLSLPQSYDTLLLYAKGGDNASENVFDVSLPNAGYSWPAIRGELWFTFGPLAGGQYTVTVLADSGASAAISFQVRFYSVPATPIAFSGDIPAPGTYGTSSVLFIVPLNGTYDLKLTASAGNFAVVLDGNPLGIVATANMTSVELTSGTHEFDITADPLEQSSSNNQWSIQVGSFQPTLSVEITSFCAPTESNVTACTLFANVTSSDGKNIAANYLWSTSGGSFNSTNSQFVLWTAPSLNQTQTYQLACNVTAGGYVGTSGSVSIDVAPVPEFVPGIALLTAVCLMISLLMLDVFAQKRRQVVAT